MSTNGSVQRSFAGDDLVDDTDAGILREVRADARISLREVSTS